MNPRLVEMIIKQGAPWIKAQLWDRHLLSAYAILHYRRALELLEN